MTAPARRRTGTGRGPRLRPRPATGPAPRQRGHVAGRARAGRDHDGGRRRRRRGEQGPPLRALRQRHRAAPAAPRPRARRAARPPRSAAAEGIDGLEPLVTAAVHTYFDVIADRGAVLVASLRSLPLDHDEQARRRNPEFFVELFGAAPRPVRSGGPRGVRGVRHRRSTAPSSPGSSARCRAPPPRRSSFGSPSPAPPRWPRPRRPASTPEPAHSRARRRRCWAMVSTTRPLRIRSRPPSSGVMRSRPVVASQP